MEIRPATPADLPAIADVVERAFTRYVARIGDRPRPMDDDYAARIARGEAYVTGDRAGVLVLVDAPDHVHVETVAVAPEAEGRGIGRALLEHAEARARARDVDEVRLYTNAKMTENLALYPHLGYREIGRRTEGRFTRVQFAKRV